MACASGIGIGCLGCGFGVKVYSCIGNNFLIVTEPVTLLMSVLASLRPSFVILSGGIFLVALS